MIRIALLAGGTSSEREISLRSAKSVDAALQDAGYETLVIDTASVSEDQLLEKLAGGYDVVFPVLHGAGGEDGSIQALLEKHCLIFVGANSASSALCFDKWQYKLALAKLDIPTPQGELVTAETIWRSELTHSPYVLKPNDGGSSVDTFIIRNPGETNRGAIYAVLAKYGSMLLEELIEGQEITVGVLGDESLPVIEIIPPAEGEFDYENKYNGKTEELCPPEHVSPEIQQAAQDYAIQIHRALGIRDISRTDIMIRASDNKLFVLETNTIPGMTDQSLLPKAAATAGLTMPQLVKTLVDAALARRS